MIQFQFSLFLGYPVYMNFLSIKTSCKNFEVLIFNQPPNHKNWFRRREKKSPVASRKKPREGCFKRFNPLWKDEGNVRNLGTGEG